MRPLNFLHVATFYPPYSFGGDAVYVQRLCQALADRGHHVEVIHCIDSYRLKPGAFPGPGAERNGNIITHGLRSSFGPLSPLLSQQTGRPWLKKRAIERVLASRRFDVVHYHNISLFGPDILRLRTNLDGAIKVYTAHEHWLVCPMHVLMKFGTHPCERPECFRCSLSFLRPPQWWRYTSLLETCANEVDLFLAGSRFLMQIHAERGFAKPFEYLPLFCDASHESPLDEPRVHPRPYFLFVGRLEHIKGVHTLIETWRRDAPFDLLIAGAGSCAPALRAMAEGNDRIRFLGPLPNTELQSRYRQALALIVPSINYEVCPVVILEALASRTPVIVRDLGSLPEAAQESGGGLTYRSDDELWDAMNRVYSSPELRTRLGENGYRAFRERWSLEPHVERYMHLLEQTARRKFADSREGWDEPSLVAQESA